MAYKVDRVMNIKQLIRILGAVSLLCAMKITT